MQVTERRQLPRSPCRKYTMLLPVYGWGSRWCLVLRGMGIWAVIHFRLLTTGGGYLTRQQRACGRSAHRYVSARAWHCSSTAWAQKTDSARPRKSATRSDDGRGMASGLVISKSAEHFNHFARWRGFEGYWLPLRVMSEPGQSRCNQWV